MLEDLLRESRDELVDRWVEAAWEVYPPETVKFFGREKDRFSNPVGFTTRTSMEELFDALARNAPADEWQEPLDKLIQVRCVQEFGPAEGLAFIFRLKQVVRGKLGKSKAAAKHLEAFDAAVDRLALAAFAAYAQFRERLYKIRVDEVKRRVSTLMRMFNTDLEEPFDPEQLTRARREKS